MGTQESTMKPTVQMLLQLESYANEVYRQGWYYGDKKQFRERHKKIMHWLLSFYDKAKEEKDGEV
jgi:hypothetical protein